MKKIILGLSLGLISLTTMAQTNKRVTEHFSVATAFGNKQNVSSIRYNQMIGLGIKNSIFVGTGIKLSHFSGKNIAFNSINKAAEGKDFSLSQSKITSLNIPALFELHTHKLLVGASIDLIGLSFGKKVDSLQSKSGLLYVRPTRVNTLLSRGNNLAELYVGYNIVDEVTIRGGFSLLRAEYSSKSSNNSTRYNYGRFGHTAIMPFISIVINSER